MSSREDEMAPIDQDRASVEPFIHNPGGAREGLAQAREEAERLMRSAGRPVRRLRVEAGGQSIDIEWADEPSNHSPAEGEAAPSMSAPAGARPAGASGTADDAATLSIRAPMVGTFYASPAPGQDPFIKVGDVVQVGQQVAILEAMKLMSPVHATEAGRVVAVVPQPGDMVEFDEVLFLLAQPNDEA